MDSDRFKEAYSHLDSLDDRLSYRIRSRSIKNRTAPALDNLDDRVKDLAEFTLELKDIMRELMLSIASKPKG